MEAPLISVIMNSGRGGYSMTGFPDQHSFVYTIQSLQRQTFRRFEFIVADYLHETRKFDWNMVGQTFFPVYHVPVTHSLAKQMGYCAISGTKNAGIMFASGSYLVFLDDCSSFEAYYLEKIYKIWQQTKCCPNPLHIKMYGTDYLRNTEGKIVQDCRFKILEDRKTDILISETDIYGYATMPLEAILKLNGYDENLDASRQLEDLQAGQRLRKLGYKTSIHKNLVVMEQQHLAVAPQPIKKIEGYDPPKTDTAFEFKPNIHCNGTYLFMTLENRTGDDYIKANHRKFTEEEKKMLRPCYKLYKSDGVWRCGGSSRGCNWMEGETSKHMTLPDSDIFINNPPVFNLAQERQNRLAHKEQYRVR